MATWLIRFAIFSLGFKSMYWTSSSLNVVNKTLRNTSEKILGGRDFEVFGIKRCWNVAGKRLVGINRPAQKITASSLSAALVTTGSTMFLFFWIFVRIVYYSFDKLYNEAWLGFCKSLRLVFKGKSKEVKLILSGVHFFERSAIFVLNKSFYSKRHLRW